MQVTVYLDEASGYLLSTADGTRIDPVTGEAIAESEEEPSEEPDEPQSPENPDTGTGAETPGDTGKTENPEESGDNGDIEAPEVSEQGGDQSSQEDSENGSASSREALIQGARIMEAPVIVEDFRFWTVARNMASRKEIFISGKPCRRKQ